MPELTDHAFFGGAQAKLNRLGLNYVWGELERALTDFDLHRENRNSATHRLSLRKFLDERFHHSCLGNSKGVVIGPRAIRLTGYALILV